MLELEFDFLNKRPIVVAIAGPNGAGKSTFFESHLASLGLRFVNADEIAKNLGIGPYDAANIAAATRNAIFERGESFVFETVLSDPIGDKIETLRRYADAGYEVVLIFIQLTDVAISIKRVSMRVNRGGHDVPDEKLLARFDRTQANLARAIERLPHVLIFDNSDLFDPYRFTACYVDGKLVKD